MKNIMFKALLAVAVVASVNANPTPDDKKDETPKTCKLTSVKNALWTNRSKKQRFGIVAGTTAATAALVAAAVVANEKYNNKK